MRTHKYSELVDNTSQYPKSIVLGQSLQQALGGFIARFRDFVDDNGLIAGVQGW